jgi:hypothetical protein
MITGMPGGIRGDLLAQIRPTAWAAATVSFAAKNASRRQHSGFELKPGGAGHLDPAGPGQVAGVLGQGT